MNKSTTTISDGSDAEGVDAAQDAPAQEQTGTAEDTDWKAEARKWEGRAKANSEAAKRLAEIEESEKTELQKLRDRVKKAEDAAAAATALAERMKLAASTGVPAELLAGPGDDPEAYARRSRNGATRPRTPDPLARSRTARRRLRGPACSPGSAGPRTGAAR